MKKVLVTGGSGFVGRKLIVSLLNAFPDIEITSLSLGDGFNVQLALECPDPRLKIEQGDIRDFTLVTEMVPVFDTLIHLAAMKKADVSEDRCEEAISTNVIGTMNLLKAFKGSTFIQMSSDKAVEPVNCYGATKMVAEKLTIERSRETQNGQRFMIIRSGNIIGSTGSVIEIWKKQILDSNEITVTDERMVRFYITVETVVDLIMAVLERGQNGKIYLTPENNAVILGDLVQKAIRLFGDTQTKVRSIGLRPGEKMAEKMCAENETSRVIRCEDIVKVNHAQYDITYAQLLE